MLEVEIGIANSMDVGSFVGGIEVVEGLATNVLDSCFGLEVISTS